jgi:delta-aminolevulinic acid dehydratase/porphobilinogen synthase
MTARKQVMRTVVSEIRVSDRRFITPIFVVPKVRILSSPGSRTGG